MNDHNKQVQNVGAMSDEELLAFRNTARAEFAQDDKNLSPQGLPPSAPNPNASYQEAARSLQMAQHHPKAPAFSFGHLPARHELVVLDDGRIVEMGPPPNATQLIQARILGKDPIPFEIIWIKILMYVRKIDNSVVDIPVDRNKVQELMNLIGDLGMERLSTAKSAYWPEDSRETLEEAKKNLRPS